MNRVIFLTLFTLACGGDDPQCRTSFDCPSDTFCLAGNCKAFEGAVNPLEEPSGTPEPSSWIPPDPTRWVHADVGHMTLPSTAPDAPSPSHPCLTASLPNVGDLRITEVLSDPPPDIDGDANNDGIRNAYEDEFIEILNTTEHALDLADVHVFVGEQYRFGFEEFCLQPQDSVILFSRGSPDMPGHLNVLTTDTRLSLSNSGGSVHLLHNEFVLDTFSFPGSAKGSWVRWPEPMGQEILRHWDVSTLPFSPGLCSNQATFAANCVNPEEPGSDPDAGGNSD